MFFHNSLPLSNRHRAVRALFQKPSFISKESPRACSGFPVKAITERPITIYGVNQQSDFTFPGLPLQTACGTPADCRFPYSNRSTGSHGHLDHGTASTNCCQGIQALSPRLPYRICRKKVPPRSANILLGLVRTVRSVGIS